MWKEQSLYNLYNYMLRRCYSSTTPNFHRYGGRGIKVCDRWLVQSPRGQGFRNFKSDVGPRPNGYSLDRRDNDGNYTPKNCRWVTRSVQYRNRSTNVWITYKGKKMIVGDWAKKVGLRSDVITKRIRTGLPMRRVLDPKRLPYNNTEAMVEAAAAKKRAQTTCKRGHPLSGDNVYIGTQGKWTLRSCLTCKREAMRRYRAT